MFVHSVSVLPVSRFSERARIRGRLYSEARMLWSPRNSPKLDRRPAEDHRRDNATKTLRNSEAALLHWRSLLEAYRVQAQMAAHSGACRRSTQGVLMALALEGKSAPGPDGSPAGGVRHPLPRRGLHAPDS